MKRDTLLIGAVLLLIGLTLSGVGAHFYFETRAFESRALRVEGTVVRLEQSRDSDGFAPVVEFKAADGATRSVTGTIYSRPPSYEVGEPVAVLYTPDEAIIDTIGQRWFLPAVLGGLGLLLGGIGGGVLAAGARRRLRAVETVPVRFEAPAPVAPAEARSTPLIVGGIFAPIAVVLVISAVLVTRSTMQLVQSSTHTTGVVVDQRRATRGARPVVEFTAADGKTVRFVGATLSSPPSFHVGEQVPVLYRPATPEQARIGTFSELWLLPVILGCVGVGFLLASGALFVAFRRERARE